MSHTINMFSEDMFPDSKVFRNKKWWSNLSPDQIDEYAKTIFDYYRATGYPYYKYTERDIRNELYRLSQINTSHIIENDIVRQTMAGLGLCWFYFPHAIEIKNLTSKSPMDIFMDDDLLMTAIKKRLRDGDNISNSALRKSLRKYGGVGVSNFRPTAAAAIYKKYGGAITWDMSGGFGGRMIGAYMARNIKSYIATDPASKTVDGLINMAMDIKRFTNRDIDIAIHCIGSENYTPAAESLDLCFTSPPYFNTERYSNEETQSYKKFPILSDWLDGFWKATLDNCMYGLKKDGYLIFNIADVKTAPNLSKDCLCIAKSIGFELIDVLQLQLSGRPHVTQDKAFKYEPIYIFRKTI